MELRAMRMECSRNQQYAIGNMCTIIDQPIKCRQHKTLTITYWAKARLLQHCQPLYTIKSIWSIKQLCLGGENILSLKTSTLLYISGNG